MLLKSKVTSIQEYFVKKQANGTNSPAWVYPKIVVPQNGWFIMENPINMDDFGGTPIFGNTQ